MTRDASLTEFGVGGDDDEPSAEGDAEAAEAAEVADVADDAAATDDAETEQPEEAPEPVRPTSRWTAEPRPCADCDTPVQRAWAVGDRLVCAACKEW